MSLLAYARRTVCASVVVSVALLLLASCSSGDAKRADRDRSYAATVDAQSFATERTKAIVSSLRGQARAAAKKQAAAEEAAIEASEASGERTKAIPSSLRREARADAKKQAAAAEEAATRP
jgi:hypothetical protein